MNELNNKIGRVLMGFRNEVQRSERMIRLDGSAKTIPDIDMAVEVVMNATETATQLLEDLFTEQVRLGRIDELEKQVSVSRYNQTADHKTWEMFVNQLEDRIDSLKKDKK